MKFYQGYFGATPSGHDLLACAPGQRERFLNILDRTDVQGILPAGTAFDTYVTAFRVELDYVVMRTSVDETATRAGMVFTHALIASTSELVEVPSLCEVVRKLKAKRPDLLDVDDIVFTPPLGDKVTDSEPSAALINALMGVTTKPPIWPDRGDFIDAMDSVWRRAWPELRSLLTFTMGLSPEDAHLSEYAVLYVPEALTGRWSGFHIIPQMAPPHELEKGASALAGGQASRELREMAQQISWPPSTFTALKDLAELQERVARVSTTPTEDIRTLRLLCFAAASPLEAVAIKRQVLKRTTANLAKASLGDLLACRNLVLSCLPDQDLFWKEMSKRVSMLFQAEYGFVRRSEYTEFLLRLSAEKPSYWREHVASGIREALTSSFATMASELIGWIIDNSAVAFMAFTLVPQTEDWERALAAALPETMSKDAIGTTLKALASSRLINLRAECLAVFLSADDAFDWELSSDVKVSALPALASRYSPDIIVSQALRTEDSRLLPMAAAALKRDTNLLLTANLHMPIWRSMIKEMRETRLEVAWGPAFSQMQKQMLLLIQSGDGDEDLFAALGKLGFFDLSHYSTDTEVWNSLPTDLRGTFVDQSIFGTVLQARSLGGQLPRRGGRAPETVGRSSIRHGTTDTTGASLAGQPVWIAPSTVGTGLPQLVFQFDEGGTALINGIGLRYRHDHRAPGMAERRRAGC